MGEKGEVIVRFQDNYYIFKIPLNIYLSKVPQEA